MLKNSEINFEQFWKYSMINKQVLFLLSVLTLTMGFKEAMSRDFMSFIYIQKIFAYGFNFAGILACANKNSAVSLTQ